MKVIIIENVSDETVKLKEDSALPAPAIHPLEAKLIFTDEAFLVPLSDISQLVFRKAKNSTHEIICTGYQGKDGKFYGDSVAGIYVHSLPNLKGEKVDVDKKRFDININKDGKASLYLYGWSDSPKYNITIKSINGTELNKTVANEYGFDDEIDINHFAGDYDFYHELGTVKPKYDGSIDMEWEINGTTYKGTLPVMRVNGGYTNGYFGDSIEEIISKMPVKQEESGIGDSSLDIDGRE